MAESLGTAVLQLDTDDKGLSRGLAGAEKKSHKSFGAIGTAAKLGAAAGFVALGFAVKDVVGDFLDDAKAAAQTAAVIKSTGGAANVTAGHVDKLATSIRNKTGIDDSAVTAGENMLLTFTNIRNGAGKNNDIFDQATHVTADYATALGTDMPTAAMQLGKALNDPVKGMTKLQRVGVTFTDQQKKQVEAMVKAGDTAGAQKVILGELSKEFGGSANAAGKTLGGQLSILKGKLEDAAGVIIAKLMPYIIRLAAWFNANLPAGITIATNALNKIQAIFNVIFGFIQTHMPLMRTLAIVIGIGAAAWALYTIAVGIASAAQAAMNLLFAVSPFGIIMIAIAALVIAMVILWRHSQTAQAIMTAVFNAIRSVAMSVFNALRAFWNAWGAQIVAIFRNYWNMIKQVFMVFVALFQGKWGEAWGHLKAAASAGWAAIVGVFTLALGTVGAAALAIGKKIVSEVKTGLDNLKSGITTKLDAGWKAISDAATTVGGKAAKIGGDIVNGIISGVGGLYGRLKAKLESDLKSVLSKINPFSPVEAGGRMFIGEPIVAGAVEGILGSRKLLEGALNTTVRASVKGVGNPPATTAATGGPTKIEINQLRADVSPQEVGWAVSRAIKTVPV